MSPSFAAVPPGRLPRLGVVAAINDEDVLSRNLAASPLLTEGRAAFHGVRGARAISLAYNEGLDTLVAEVMIFAHQDVYLPAGFETRLRAAIAEIERLDPDWGVLGVFGVDESGQHCGRTWSSGLGRALELDTDLPARAQSLDELVIVVRTATGVRFDPALPHFHLYGTDIVQIARAAGYGAWVADLPVIHNSRFVARLGPGFAAAYRHLQRKWRAVLPIRTPVLWLTPSGIDLWRKEFALWRTRNRRLSTSVSDQGDPHEIAERLGWAHPADDVQPTIASASR
ncbi:MAG: hypothetical protein AAGI34_19765 [Pseudomonadota bacterium]